MYSRSQISQDSKFIQWNTYIQYSHMISANAPPKFNNNRLASNTMAVPTYEELLAHCNVDNSLMEQTFSDDHLMEFTSQLDKWETLALSLRLPSPEIENIRSAGDIEMQRYKLLKCWKQRCGSMATYKALVEALLQISRTDLAEKVVGLQQSLRDTTRSPLIPPSETNLTTPTSSVSSSGIEDMSPLASMSYPSPLSLANKDEPTAQAVKEILQELEEEFLKLVIHIEDTLKNNQINLDAIIRPFSMLPQLVKRQHETDENYKKARRRILDSKTVKELFDNLTELKHWNYMMPDMLAHILKGVEIDEVQQKINEYKDKLMAFKANTKLRELIGITFPVPDYCMELIMKVEGWEDKTIQEAENCAINIIPPAANGGRTVRLGWKVVNPGSIKLTFILIESLKVDRGKLLEMCKDRAVKHVQIDGEHVYSNGYTEVKAFLESDKTSKLWYRTNTTVYSVHGSRNVLIIAPDLSLPHPEAVARRPGQLTEEDKLKLQSQGLPPDCQKELNTVEGRCKLDKRLQIVEIVSGKSITRERVLESIAHLLNTTSKDGGKYYISIYTLHISW